MIFVDTNVLMYAVGGDHPLREDARFFFEEALERRERLVTSAEVLQELLHALSPGEPAGDPGRGAHAGLLHLACCRRREVAEIKTFDRGLVAAFRQP
ncbi:MAG: hypothetical protein A3K13_08350 [Gemmatimonadetes bacterium RIFCSPLOWO2_12_FULL_68_9]|nr:MAG: hypothetical protein A3K13_08350 [Gemmatimonadetes bacterium RIFCSPLOWO2_12_FULL_68_9]